MREKHARLINAARRSMIQRAALERRLKVARDALRPSALADRGKYRLTAQINETVTAAREEFRAHRIPFTLAALAGALWFFREPIRHHAPRAAQRLRTMVDDAVGRIWPAAAATTRDVETENEDETAQ